MSEQVYANRELSWLKFNQRVLEEAAREEVPLCERLSFASIYQSNLDEFFMVRVGSLVDQMALPQEIRENKTNMTAKEQIAGIMREVLHLNERKDEIFASLMDELKENGVRLVDFHHIGESESRQLEHYFDREIAPLLSPIVVGKRQPFPFLRNQEIYAAVVLNKKSKGKNSEKLGIIPCASRVIPRLITVSQEPLTFMLSEELILHFVSKVFKNFEVMGKSLIRVTRNADIDADALYDEDLDYREFMSDLIKKRKRLTPIRLEMSRELDEHIVQLLCKYLKTDHEAVFRNHTPLDLSFLFSIQDYMRSRPELFYEKRSPQRPAELRNIDSMLDCIRQKDRLLSYPYDSMRPFLQMLREAANDDEVLSIKMTLYRVSRNSEVVECLIDAAENGKDVEVLVELKARFDEENNIEWSRRLEEAGCQVIYGLGGYKVHSKLCLITRRSGDEVEYFTQIGTGNYNEKTARQYTDYALMTHDTAIGQNAAAVFQALSKGETLHESDVLLVAPNCLQNRVLELINREIARAQQGKKAYIGIKINSLTDKKIIDRLIEASKAGVRIDMVVRGICCLLPNVAGETENIRIVSIVGRFLEHSRIYIFGAGEEQPADVYIASADFMTRNTLRRVEVAAPVQDADIRGQILYMFDCMLRDNQQAWILDSDGSYHRNTDGEQSMNSQEHFFEEAYRRAENA